MLGRDAAETLSWREKSTGTNISALSSSLMLAAQPPRFKAAAPEEASDVYRFRHRTEIQLCFLKMMGVLACDSCMFFFNCFFSLDT